MSETEKRPRALASLTVALAGPAPDNAMLDLMARLAAALEVELRGVFVEDDSFLNLARLPGARVFSLSGIARPVDAGAMARALRREAEAAERAFAQVAESAGARWSFEVSRAPLAAQVAAIVETAELMALGFARRRHAALRLAPAHGARPRAQARDSRPLAVVFTGSPASRRALDLAGRIATLAERALSVLLVAANEASAEALRAQAERLLEDRRAQFGRLINPDVATLLARTEEMRPLLLILEAGPPMLHAEAVRRLNEELSVPSLLVR